MKKNSKSIACARSQIVHRSWITLFLLFFSFFCFAQDDTWQQMQQLLPKKIIRQSAFSFNIGSKGYVGWAYTPDFWEYDPVTDIWTQKSDFGRGGGGETGFSIGNKGYVFSYQYFWEYDPATNSWKQKADFGGTARENAVGFSIGNKGYIGTGTNTGDFWEYDPATDTWTRKADFAGGARFNATGFSIGTRGYIGLGRNANEGNYVAKNDFWEYNPATNAWNQRADFGGSARYGAASFSIGTKGYIGTGIDLGGNTGDFWEYGPATDTWTRKADFIGEPAAFAIGLSIDGKGYLGLGHTVSFGEFITHIDEYDPAADAWTYKTALGGGGRVAATGFSIGTKGYIGLGITNDFWEYNASDNTWTQKANFEGVGRYGATGFSIGNKGYIGIGGSTDYWEYDPANNVWSKKADFAGGARSNAAGFSIGNKGYVGTGYSLNDGQVGAKKDFWEYDPATNTWTQKADFGGAERYSAIGFSIGSKGYVGTGSSYLRTQYFSDFWEYDPLNNTWSQKADFGGGVRSKAVGFGIGKKGYIGTGDTLVENPYIDIFRKDFWEYDPYTNGWTKKADFGVFGRYSATGFSIGSNGYLGFGLEFNSWNQRLGAKDYCSQCPIAKNDWWKYTPKPEDENSITTTIGSTTLSPGSSVGVKFLPAGSFDENSFFTAQLSDPTGDFATLVSIGEQRGYGSGIIKAIIPANTIPGNTYRIRVVSSNPAFIGTDNGSDLTIIKPQPDTWVQKADFIGRARLGGTAFSIGKKGYIGLGRSNKGDDFYNNNDFWEYDPSIDAWTQKANFGGTARFYATGFNIGSKGYIGAGSFVYGYNNDFWEYDPATNTWTQKADFGGAARYQATGFSIGSKGYIGTGWTDSGPTNDFWEYDPVTNTWTQKANFGGTARELATGFSIGSKGYISNGFVPQNDFWEYDPAKNTWIQKADFGGGMRYSATGFSIGSKGYIGTGNNSSGDNSSLLNDFWEYNPATNSWTQKADFGDVPRAMATGFSIGSKGYIGLGNSDWIGFNLKNDWWEYTPTPETKNSITTTIASTTFCTGSPVDVNFVPGGSVNENSFFTAQLSDPKGDFAKSVSIGKLRGFGTGIIKAIIPFNTIPGNTYRIRVVSNNPTFAGSNNGANITINQGPVLTSAITAPAICNNTVFAYTPAAIPAGTVFSWSRPEVAGIANPAANSAAENNTGTINEKLINTRTAPVNVAYNYLLNNNGCNKIAYKVTVTVKPSPLVKTKNITVYLNENGVVTITPKQVDNGSVSYCGSISYVLDKMSFNCSNIGVNKVKLTVKDCIGNASTGSACVVVKDNIPPVISDASANPAILWPPNHSMRNVTVNYTVKDNCCVASTAITVKSNEPSVNNETDWIVVDKHHLQLRADRAGNGSGRVYTITISAKDVYGNSSTKVVTVTVPHNQNSAKSEAAIVGFDAAENGLSVQAMPNPSQHYFTLITKSNSDAPLAVSVTDAAGKLIEVRNNVTVKSKLELGNGYRPGTYYVQVIQGNNKATVTLVKQGN